MASLDFLQSVKEKSHPIAIAGMGYVGLPLALRLSEVGFPIVGIDINKEKNALINAGQSPIEHIERSRIKAAQKIGFEVSDDFSRVSQASAIIICVPTPLNGYREPDLSYVTSTLNSLVPHLQAGQMLSLESTTYPGTTEEVLAPILENAGFTLGEDLYLVYSPEREDPGNASFNTQTIPKVCAGLTPRCLEYGLALYGTIVDQVVPTSSTRAAEMTKLLENIHRAVNIGLVNEMKIICQQMNIDVHEVIDAASTKPFGFTAFYPGPGIGGHCIPVDPFYLAWKAKEFGIHTQFIELAGEINRSMPQYVLEKTTDALNDREKALKNSRILVLGIAYKKNVDDMRESPSVEIMQLLRSKGALVSYSDPHVPHFPQMRRHQFDLASIKLTPESIRAFDCVILATDHDAFAYDQIAEHAQLIIDTRGTYRPYRRNILPA